MATCPKANGCPFSISRRRFLHGCACASAVALLPGCIGEDEGEKETKAGPRPRVRLVFTHTGGATWPNVGYDYEGRKKALTEALAKECPGIELLPATVHNGNEAKKLLEEDKTADVDGYLIYMVGLWTGAPPLIAATGKPTLLVDDLYAGSGEFLIQFAAARRAKRNVAGVSSSRFKDVIAAARCFGTVKQPGQADRFAADCMTAARKRYPSAERLETKREDQPPACDVDECLKQLRASTILLVGRKAGGFEKAAEAAFGTKTVALDFPPLEQAHKGADAAEAEQWAGRWTREAEKVMEPSAEEIQKSAAMYVGMRKLMEQHQARAITINCLGGFYGGHISAYPCLGFCQLNNDGLVGACESDMRSTLTMLVMTTLTGRPGFISDPVLDTSRNQIIYAHCVAPFKVYGTNGPTNPYHIRSHSEDRKGAALRSLMPLGRMTTTVEIDPGKKQILFHQGKAVANIDEDKACRTKLAAEVKGDIDKLMNSWDQWGWHRVTYYGDLSEPVRQLAAKLSYEVVEEA